MPIPPSRRRAPDVAALTHGRAPDVAALPHGRAPDVAALGPCRWNLPDPAEAPAGEEVVAVGADLEPSTLVAAYSRGLFPMHLADGPLGWWSPDPRGILPLDGLIVSKSLRRSLRRFTYSVDAAFTEVMLGCADERRDAGWITSEFLDAYTALHRMGWAHSVEVWQEGRLVGGLYGVEVGGLFAGESMFHRATDASKAALVVLVERLRACGGQRLLDVQWRTDHLGSLGAVEIPRAAYLRRLAAALPMPPCLADPVEDSAAGDREGLGQRGDEHVHRGGGAAQWQ